MATPTPEQLAQFDSLLGSGNYAAAATMAQEAGYNPATVTGYIGDKFGADKGQMATQWYSDQAGLTQNSNSIIGGANSYSLPSSYSYNAQPAATPAPTQQPAQQPTQYQNRPYQYDPSVQQPWQQGGYPSMGGMGQMGMGYSPYGNPYQMNPYMMGGGFGGYNNYGMPSGFGIGMGGMYSQPQSYGGMMSSQMGMQQQMQNPYGRARSPLQGSAQANANIAGAGVNGYTPIQAAPDGGAGWQGMFNGTGRRGLLG